MKKITFLFLMMLGSCYASFAQVFQNNDVTITKLEDNMWVVETSDKTTMYIVEGKEKALLIDTGTKCAKLDSIVGLITKKPLSVVITHMHGDHAGNINFFKDIYVHPADTVLLNRANPYKGKMHFVQDGYVFDLGGIRIEVVHMPGHTPGSIVLIDKKAGNCYSGDAFGSGQVWLQLRPNLPMATYAASCKRMEQLMDAGITRVYCGHYFYVKKPFDKSYISHMRQLAEALIKGTAPEGKPYPTKVSIGCDNPMITSLEDASIVYDPAHIN